jgi:SAM-dependent methyltransferase
VLNRYHNLEAYPRLFARFKMRFDPMFLELQPILKSSDKIETIIDIGCGYGVPSCWLLERFPNARLYGIEPSKKRARIASLALGVRGTVTQGYAPDVPEVPRPADLTMLLDMVHFLNDDDLLLTLERVGERMREGGRLIVRATLRPRRRLPWVWWFENAKLRLSGVTACYRSAEQLEKMIARSDFQMTDTLPSGVHNELLWLVADATRQEMPRVDDAGAEPSTSTTDST